MIEEHSPRGLATALRATTASARDRWRYCAVVSTPGHATETQIRQFARGEDRFRARRRGTRSVDPWAGKRCPAALSERAPRMKAVTCTATARSELYGQVSVGQAGYYAYRKPSSPTSRFQDGPPDSRFVYLSDVAPTAWQAVAYADIPDGGWLGDGAGTRTDRRHGGSHRSPPRLSGHCRRQGAGADPRLAACTRSISTNTATISGTSSAT